MKTFLVGLALGLGIGFFFLSRNGDQREQLINERARELQRSLPNNERTVNRTQLRSDEMKSPSLWSTSGVHRPLAIQPIDALNIAPEQELVSDYRLDGELARKIVDNRPYSSVQDAMDRGIISPEVLVLLREGAWRKEPGHAMPL